MLDENKILTQIASGDTNAFKQLFEFYYSQLQSFAYTYLEDKAEVDDTLQQCFIKLWEKREQYRGKDSVKAYLYSSVRNNCLNKIRHKSVVEKSAEELALESIFAESYSQETDNSLNELLKKGVDQLPDKNKEVVQLRFYSGMSTKEVSEELGITPRTVETHVSKALRFLRDMLNPVIIILLTSLNI